MFNEVYDQLYKKNPDSLARKVNVAVPDPLHNKVTITENGEQDVVNYAVADIDIEDSGGGGGGSSATPLVDIHVVNNSNNNIYLLYEGIINNIYSFVVGTAISSTQSEDITAIATDSNDPNSVWSLNGPCTDSSGYEGQILPFTISDAENCSYDSASYGYPCIKITDPSQNASCTITYN